MSFSIPEGLLHSPGCGLVWGTYCLQLNRFLFTFLKNITHSQTSSHEIRVISLAILDLSSLNSPSQKELF